MSNSALTPSEAPQRFSLRLQKDGFLPRILVALGLSVVVAAVLILLAQKNPLEAFSALLAGAFGSPHQIGVALNRTSPYLFAGAGLALCFRAGVINMGSDGQIAMGGIGATATILAWPGIPGPAAAITALVVAALAGGLWAGLATAIHLFRRVHEVLATLLLNFVALLLVQLLLSSVLGQPGAGFLQSPLMPRTVWLPRIPVFDFHIGIVLAVLAAALVSFLLWKTTFGFGVRVAGRSRPAAAYAGFSIAGITWQLMLSAGAMAGLGGGVEILGLQHRLIEGFSSGFGFKAVTVALLGALEPALTIPAALFVGFLETGALAMQRQIGVPSSLVTVIEAATMLFILAATVRRT
ncbi:ABC transporter permease [Oryzifoliimicrobium ureilyticus]|uniref:ABC transporter permease n=1 Tax=Oryzifoliimicrobium ureilyticus TaxID=3113724 RepID=UPI0030765DA8